ncbi:MAG TPA: hypothetical protein PKM65_19470 [Spirochaetota bacterium]|nr:hypothetical protein [Spirochaetota bacterium]HNT12990.1 hypothetical protein [Spirochaetota bacterium]
MKINKNSHTEIRIINVERGLSILIKTPQSYCILYDLGSTSSFSPVATFYKNKLFDTFVPYTEPEKNSKKIAQCIISHPHLDHISDLNIDNTNILKENSFYVTCQNDKVEGKSDRDNKSGHKINFKRINNPENAADEIENYKDLYKTRNLPLSTLIHHDESITKNLKIGYYYITHQTADGLFPEDNQKYSNSLSIVLYISHGDNSILIPGDVTPEAIKLIIDGKCEKRFTDYSIIQGANKKIEWATSTSDQPNLKTLLKRGLTILVAPHHGLESGYPDYLFEVMGEKKPDLIIISEKTHNSSNSGSTHKNYQNGIASSGRNHKNEWRYSLSTVNDSHIKITFTGNDCITDSNKEIEKIFE